MMQLPAYVTAYLDELAADIVAHGGLKDGQTVEDAMTDAHARRQAFAEEMWAGRTDRAIKARKALTEDIYRAARKG